MSPKVAVTGASGLIGQPLTRTLAERGWSVIRLVRRRAKTGEASWDPDAGTIDAQALEGVAAVVHLAGANIGQRWTPARRQRIRSSRVKGTRLLAATLAALRTQPAVMVCSSGIGIYGDQGDDVLNEREPPGSGFLADLGRDWEAAAESARRAGIRVVHLRTGVVLTPDGGALARMLPFFRLGIGGQLGCGRQWMSWITLRDHVEVILTAIALDALAGPVNSVAPEPVRNLDFTRALGEALNRPTVIPVPALALELVYGQMARETLLASQRAIPERLLSAGFTFHDPEIAPALRRMLA